MNNRVIICILFTLVLFMMEHNTLRAADGAGVYGGGPFYHSRDVTIPEIRQTGFNWICIWTIHVMNEDGDLNFNAEFPLVEDGVYIGNSTYPHFDEDVATIKTDPTTVEWIEFGLSAWGSSTFDHIKTIVQTQGTGPGSPLYENFRALKEAIPEIDAISFDDESTYDAPSATEFAIMLADLGYKVSLCPYTQWGFWSSVESNTNSQRPGTIEDVHLQCYAGGAGNNPCTWRDYFSSGINVMPGVLDNGVIGSRMANWNDECTIYGGWVWIYDDFYGDLPLAQSYADAINDNVSEPWVTDTVAVTLGCDPATGTLPFTTQITAQLINMTTDKRRAAGRMDVVIADGTSYGNWRGGWTNLGPSELFTQVWNQNLPGLGKLVGNNVFTLTGVDVTPAPFNQPPYPPAGDTGTASCTVTGIAP